MQSAARLTRYARLAGLRSRKQTARTLFLEQELPVHQVLPAPLAHPAHLRRPVLRLLPEHRRHLALLQRPARPNRLADKAGRVPPFA